MKKYILIVPVLMSLIWGSCSDEIFKNQKDYEDHYKVGDDIRSSIIGLYSGLQNVQERLVILNEVRGDLLLTTNNAPLDIKALEMWEYSADNDWLSPSPIYKVIVNCNDILTHIHEVKEKDASFSDTDYKMYLAEVLTIRAWCYYQLYLIYDEVPYHESPVLEAGDLQLAEVDLLDTLNTQLDSAIVTFSSIEDDVSINPLRFNRFTALVLSGEVNLSRKDYDKAYSSLIHVVADDSYGFGNEYANESWVNIFSSDISNSDKEIITWLDFNIIYNQQHQLQRYFSTGQGGSYWFRPGQNAIEGWENQVDRKGNVGDKYRGKGISYKETSSGVMVNKYSIDREYFANDMNLIVYRASTAALLFAEAANRKGSPLYAAMILNNGIIKNGVRGRVNLDKQGEGISDVDELESVIVNEMALELAFEGRRYNDLIRIAERKEDRTWLAEKIAAKFDDPAMREQMKNKIMNAESLKIPFMW